MLDGNDHQRVYEVVNYKILSLLMVCKILESLKFLDTVAVNNIGLEVFD